jgi:hypothetical protein
MSGVVIIASYAGIVAIFGWWGALAAAAHIAVLLLATNRK